MLKLGYVHFSAAALPFAALIGLEARSAELEGALQYPPPSVEEDAQPPPPARTVQQLVSPLTGGVNPKSTSVSARKARHGPG